MFNVTDMLINIANSKASSIAKFTGKSEKEVRAAINKGREIIPALMNSRDGGITDLKAQGIDKAFIEDMYGRFGKYADRLPLGRSVIDRAYRNFTAKFESNNGESSSSGAASSFDKSKYRKV